MLAFAVAVAPIIMSVRPLGLDQHCLLLIASFGGADRASELELVCWRAVVEQIIIVIVSRPDVHQTASKGINPDAISDLGGQLEEWGILRVSVVLGVVSLLDRSCVENARGTFALLLRFECLVEEGCVVVLLTLTEDSLGLVKIAIVP